MDAATGRRKNLTEDGKDGEKGVNIYIKKHSKIIGKL
jgi:hypothetical protein